MDAEGNVTATSTLYKNTAQDPDQTQLFRVVSYPKDYAGVRALQ